MVIISIMLSTTASVSSLWERFVRLFIEWCGYCSHFSFSYLSALPTSTHPPPFCSFSFSFLFRACLCSAKGERRATARVSLYRPRCQQSVLSATKTFLGRCVASRAVSGASNRGAGPQPYSLCLAVACSVFLCMHVCM